MSVVHVVYRHLDDHAISTTKITATATPATTTTTTATTTSATTETPATDLVNYTVDRANMDGMLFAHCLLGVPCFYLGL